MTRAQFLNDLYRRLSGNGMKAEQAEQHLTYYAEMLADRMEEGMSEDEAVGSMEDVETIARRVLEEEGLSYQPPEERPVTPPEYPDASKLGGGGGKRAYQAPRKNGRKVVQAVLWVLAVVIALGAAGRWFLRRSYRVPENPADWTVDEAVPAPEAPYVEEYAYLDAPYAEGYGYDSGEYSFSYDEVSSVDVQWASGTVYVQSWSGDSVQIHEYANSELSERTRMDCQSDSGKLTVRYRSGTGLGSVKGSKWLTVLVPDGMLEELDIQTTSAEVRIYGLELSGLDVSTTSGRISASECYTKTANLTTTSGDMDLSTLHAEALSLGTTSGYLYGTVVSGEIEASSISGDISLYSEDDMKSAQLSSVSGDIYLSLEDSAAQSIGANSTSGDISLSVPYDLGFTMSYSTVSGSVNNSLSDMLQQNGKYVRNGGGCEIEVETVSGDLSIY